MISKTKKQLARENEQLRQRLEEVEDTLQAIHSGDIDAIVISAPNGDQIYTLQNADRPYRILVEEMQEGAITVSLDGLILYSNRRFAEMIKTPLENVLGASIYSLVALNQQESFRALMHECQTRSTHCEVELIAGDGSTLPMYFALSIIPVDPITTICLVATDLSERKHSEEATRRLAIEQAAREQAELAQRRFAFLTEISTVLASSLDENTIFKSLARLVVPRFADWYLIEMIDTDRSLCRIIVVATEPELEQAIIEHTRPFYAENQDSLAGQTLKSLKPLFMRDILAEDGETSSERSLLSRELGLKSLIILPMTIREKPIGTISVGMADSGRLFSADDLGLAEEMARRASQAVDNARLYAEAQRAISLRDEFLSIAAHELRTPVTSLWGFTQTLLRQLKKRGTIDLTQLQQALQHIDQQSDKLARLLSMLLDVSRLGVNRLSLERKATDVATLVNSLAASLQNNAKRHTITVKGPSTVMAFVDPLRIEQVIANLLDNAIKYSPDGEFVRVELSELDGQTLRLVVTDHGVGIPPEHRARIFDRFFQAHGDGYQGGMGLGLYISKQIILLHHGELEAEFPSEGGTKFTVTLPRALAS
jgi:PAS domain S-box-containing protein